MNIRTSILSALVALALATAVNAEESKLPGTSLRPPTPGSEFFPSELADKGVHGEVWLLADVDARGKLSALEVQKSSGSPELDALAQRYAQATGVYVRGDAQPTRMRIQVRFTRDGLWTLASKSCRDFNVDLQYARSIRPDAKAADIPAYKLAVGNGIIIKPGADPVATLDSMSRLRDSGAQVEAACAKDPDAKFLEVFRRITSGS